MSLARDERPIALPTEEQFYADPHGWAQKLAGHLALHAFGPITWVFRHDLVQGLVKDERLRQVRDEVFDLKGFGHGPIRQWYLNVVLAANGADHARLRAPLQRTFAFPLMQAMRPSVEKRVEALADEMERRLEADGVVAFDDVFANVLPVSIICEVLGVPEADIPKFRHYADELGLLFGLSREGDEARLDAAITYLQDYADKLVSERRARPKDDFLSALTAVVDETRTYTEAELLAQVAGLIFAGHDTTRTALACGMYALLRHPEQWRRLAADPSLARGAVDETLRYEPAIGGMPRIVAEPIEIEGRRFEPGTVVYLAFSAAQRDPSRYADPQTLDITRSDVARNLVVFGGGGHRCLGEALARIELEASFAHLAPRFPDLALAAPEPVFDPFGTGIRKLTSVLVTRRRQ